MIHLHLRRSAASGRWKIAFLAENGNEIKLDGYSRLENARKTADAFVVELLDGPIIDGPIGKRDLEEEET